MLFSQLKLFTKECFIALIILSSYFSYAEIIEVDNLNKIQQDFEEIYNKNYLPQDILVIIGLEELVFKPLFPNAPYFGEENAPTLIPILQKIKPQSKKLYMDQVMLVDYKQELLDPDLPNFIKIISNNNTPIIAVNNGFTGNFNNIPNLEIWLADYLKKDFNIDFSQSFIKNNYIIFNNLESFDNTYPVFYKGILSSNNTSQSSLIISFLIQMNFIPKVLIMVSGDEELLNSVDEQLKSYTSSTMYIGYHYTAPDQDEGNAKDLTYYIKFFNDLVNKINKVQRKNPTIKTNKQNNKNPYDEKQ